MSGNVLCLAVLATFLLSFFAHPLSAEQRAGSKGTPAVHAEQFRNKLFYLKDGNVWLMDMKKKSSTKVTKTGDVDNFSVSSDGSKAALIRKSQLHLLDLLSGEEALLTAVETDESPPSIAPSNDKIAYVNYSQEEFLKKLKPGPKATKRVRHIWLYDLATKKNGDMMEKSSLSHSAPKWSPDGARMTYAAFTGVVDKDWRVFVRDTASGESREISDGFYTEWVDNKTVLISERKGQFCWFSLDANDKVDGFNTRTNREYSIITYSPANGRICLEVEATGGKQRNIDCYDKTTGKIETIVEGARKPMFSR